MIGSMAAFALPSADSGGPSGGTEASAIGFVNALAEEDRIEVPVGPFPVLAARHDGAPPTATLLRISAQRYNEPADYEVLVEALARRGFAVGPSASAIVAR